MKEIVLVFLCIFSTALTQYRSIGRLKVKILEAGDNSRIRIRRGESTTLTCEGSGTPTPSVSWEGTYRRNEMVTESRGTRVRLTVRPDRETEYICNAENKLGMASTSVWVEVNGQTNWNSWNSWSSGNSWNTWSSWNSYRPTDLEVETEPSGDITINRGESVELICRGKGSPRPEVEWEGYQLETLYPKRSEYGGQQVAETRLRVSPTSDTVYVCIASNSDGTEEKEIRVRVRNGNGNGDSREINDNCLGCLCVASGGDGCNNRQCDGQRLCGWFAISIDYWRDCGSPEPNGNGNGYRRNGVRRWGNNNGNSNAFTRCSTDYDCASRCVKEYMQRNINACALQSPFGDPTCADFANLHFSGRSQCQQSNFGGTIDSCCFNRRRTGRTCD